MEKNPPYKRCSVMRRDAFPVNLSEPFEDPYACQLKLFMEGVHSRTSQRDHLLIKRGKLYRRLHDIVRRRVDRFCSWAGRSPPHPPVVCPPLHLQPGEWVRVKEPEEIRKTLTKGSYDKLYHIPEPMDPLGGQVFQVLKRVERFYEECQKRPVKCKDMVILDGAFCDGSQHRKIGGACDRGCLLFWKEAWLERPDPGSFRFAPHVGGYREDGLAQNSSSEVAGNGRRMRVKPIEAIMATLDQEQCCGYLPFVRSLMEPYCGKTYHVYRPLRHVYDERNVWFTRFAHALVLEGVYCVGARLAMGGLCDRSCSFFWHETWLEEIK